MYERLRGSQSFSPDSRLQSRGDEVICKACNMEQRYDSLENLDICGARETNFTTWLGVLVHCNRRRVAKFRVRCAVVAHDDDLEASIDHLLFRVIVGSKRPRLTAVVVSRLLVERDGSSFARARACSRGFGWTATSPLPDLSPFERCYVAGVDSNSVVDGSCMRRLVKRVVEAKGNRFTAIVGEIGSASKFNAMVWRFRWGASND